MVNKQFGKIAVILGGTSREREISLRSGEAIYQALRRIGLDAYKLDAANGVLSEIRKRKMDIAFLALHGKGGEDGTIQKILGRYRIPYIGSDPKASEVCFNKVKAKRRFIRFGIPTPRYSVLTRKNWKKIIEGWVPPYVIKPVDEGSSIGVSFVYDIRERARVIRSTLQKYPVLLVEQMIEGREFTVGILGQRSLSAIELQPKRKFYDFKAKYTKGLTDYLIPAPIDKRLEKKLKVLALRAHHALGLRHLSRVDFRLDFENQPYVLEVNSIPGFTETSLLPKAARAIGIDFAHLCLSLLNMANKRSSKK